MAAMSYDRVIKIALGFLEKVPTESLSETEKENLLNNMVELEILTKSLHNSGMTFIHHDGRHNGNPHKCIHDKESWCGPKT